MKDLKLKKLTSDIGLNVTRQVLRILILLLLTVLIARWLGPGGNGKYTLAVLVPTLLARFINLGVINANNYYVGRKSLSLSDAFKLNWILGSCLTVIGLVLGGILVEQFKNSFFAEISTLLLFISLIAFPFFFEIYPLLSRNKTINWLLNG